MRIIRYYLTRVIFPQYWIGFTIFARKFARRRADCFRGQRYSYSSALLDEIRSSGGFRSLHTEG